MGIPVNSPAATAALTNMERRRWVRMDLELAGLEVEMTHSTAKVVTFVLVVSGNGTVLVGAADPEKEVHTHDELVEEVARKVKEIEKVVVGTVYELELAGLEVVMTHSTAKVVTFVLVASGTVLVGAADPEKEVHTHDELVEEAARKVKEIEKVMVGSVYELEVHGGGGGGDGVHEKVAGDSAHDDVLVADDDVYGRDLVADTHEMVVMHDPDDDDLAADIHRREMAPVMVGSLRVEECGGAVVDYYSHL